MSHEASETQTNSFFDLYTEWVYSKISGRSSFRNPKLQGHWRIFAALLYPISLIEAAISPFVIAGLAIVFDPWTRYFSHICALLAYGSVVVGIGYAFVLLIG